MKLTKYEKQKIEEAMNNAKVWKASIEDNGILFRYMHEDNQLLPYYTLVEIADIILNKRTCSYERINDQFNIWSCLMCGNQLFLEDYITPLDEYEKCPSCGRKIINDK